MFMTNEGQICVDCNKNYQRHSHKLHDYSTKSFANYKSMILSDHGRPFPWSLII